MNVLIDAHVFDEAHQGSRTYLKGMYREVVKSMSDTSFFFAGYDSKNFHAEIGSHPNVYFIQLKQKKLLRLLLEFPLIIRKYKIDYAHFQYVSPPLKNCKHIVTTHDILFKDFRNLFPVKYRVLNNFLFWLSARRANVLLTVSEYSKKRIAKHYKIPVEKIGITPNGISKEFFDLATPSIGEEICTKYKLEKFILYISRIEPRKNHLFLLRAFSELKLWERGYKLVFIGKKDFLFEDIDTFLANSVEECKGSVLMLQNIENIELIAFYKKASLFVYPSLAEGFGIPPIEAISAGTPTLCSNSTAMSDFSFLGEDLFDPHNISELKAKILRKLLDLNDAGRIAELKQIVAEKYSWSEASKVFISFLKKDLESKKKESIIYR